MNSSSLSRVLEAELMDTLEEARDYNSMDHSHVNRRFVDELLSVSEITGDVLDLGTGTALIPIELCRRAEGFRVMAADAAINMLELARLNVEIANLTERITLANVDAKQLPFSDRSFAVVISNSIIHHIPEPIGVLREAIRVTAPGGLLFFRDLMRPADDAAVCQLVASYAGEANEHQQRMFDDSLRAALSLEEIRGLIESIGFSAETVQATSDRHWTWVGRRAA